MKSIGKANFKNDGLEKFSEYYTENFNMLNELVNKLRVKYHEEKKIVKEHENQDEGIDWRKLFESIQDNYYGWANTTKKVPDTMLVHLKRYDEYIRSICSSFFVVAVHEGIAFITYGNKENLFPIYNYEEFLDIEMHQDYSSFTLESLKQVAAIENKSVMGLMLHNNAGNTSLNDLCASKAELNEKVRKVKSELEVIKEAKTGELAKAKAEIDKIKEELKKKEDELQAKIKDQLAIIEEKKRELEAQVQEMQIKIKVMDSTIYTIRCFLGETYELVKIRDGAKAKLNTPLVVNQKMKFLDEELAKLISVYDVDGEKYRIIEDLLKYNDTAFEYFCPQDKCISFVRVSQDNKAFQQVIGRGMGGSVEMLKSYNYLHGEKIGFFIRNGEQLFLGWTDEEYIQIYSEDAFLKAGYGQVSEYDGDMEEGQHKITSGDEMASRFFIMSILQGILETEDIINLPKPINVFFPDPTRIIYSFADNWITERKYGSFMSTMKRLNEKNMVGDTILVLMNLREYAGYSRHDNSPRRGREGAWQNRTHDCHVSDGIHRINLIDDSNNVFVSAKKEWSYKNSSSNFLINEGEYINITYWNSEWIRYYIVNKEIGNVTIGGEKVNYAHFVKFLNIAKQHIVAREAEERKLIEVYYPALSDVRDWMVLLTHWKIINNVRYVTEFQAKRFAKCLISGKIKLLKHLHADECRFDWELPEFNSIKVEWKNTQNSGRKYYFETIKSCEIYRESEPSGYIDINGENYYVRRYVKTVEKNDAGQTKYLCYYNYTEYDNGPESIEKFKAIIAAMTRENRETVLKLFERYGYTYNDILAEAKRRQLDSGERTMKVIVKQLYFFENIIHNTLDHKHYHDVKNDYVERFMELFYQNREHKQLPEHGELYYYNDINNIYFEMMKYIRCFEIDKYESDLETKMLQEYLKM